MRTHPRSIALMLLALALLLSSASAEGGNNLPHRRSHTPTDTAATDTVATDTVATDTATDSATESDSESLTEESAAEPLWENWARTQTCAYLSYTNVTSEQQIVNIINQANAEGSKVSVVGSSHSFGASVVIDVPESGHMIDLRFFDGLVRSDRELYTFRAGTIVETVIETLEADGWTIPNAAAILHQTIAGVASTNTHGTGNTQGMSAFVAGVRLVTGNGTVMEVTAESDPDLMKALLPGLGVMGVYTEITIKAIPMFRARQEMEILFANEFLEKLPSLLIRYDRFQFVWQGGSEIPGYLMTFTPTIEPVTFNGSGCLGAFTQTCVDVGYKTWSNYRNWGFNPMEKSAIPWHNEEANAPVEYATEFLSTWVDKFNEMYPTTSPEQFYLVQHSFRFIKADHGFLSPFNGHDAVSLDFVFVTENDDAAEAYHDAFAEHSLEYEARMHWGKQTRYTAEQTRKVYPEFDLFQEQRRRIDPSGVFLKNLEYQALFGDDGNNGHDDDGNAHQSRQHEHRRGGCLGHSGHDNRV